MRSRKIRIGFDLDGTLIKHPWPIAMFLRHRKRARCGFLVRHTLLLIEKFPIVLNGPLIDSIPKEIEIFIITSRIRNTDRALQKLAQYRFWVAFYHRTDAKEHDSDFKARMCKKLKINMFFEDRLSTIKELREKNIDAVDVYEVLECL